MRILLLASDPSSAALGPITGLEGWTIETVGREADVAVALEMGRADVLVFDADFAAADFAERMRRRYPIQPIVAWLARGSSERAAALLEAGASEVVTGAMGARERAARILGVVRRTMWHDATIELGALVVDRESGEATWAEQDLGLTGRERQLLHALAASAGRTVRREKLYRQVWGYRMARGDRAVDVNIRRLRAKLAAAAGGAVTVKTQSGVGYRLEVATEVAVTAL